MTPLQPGVKVGRYEVGEPIRLEPVGALYRVHDAASGARFALTPLPGVEGDSDGLYRVEQAVRALIRLRHPNLAAVVDVGEFEGTPYIIVADIPDVTLSDLMAQGTRLGQEQSLRLLRGAADGIDAAYREGAVHGELRPEMIFIDGAGNVVIAGFGLGRLLAPRPVTTMATQYVAPDRVMGFAVGPAADVYALTALAYQLLAGRSPFDQGPPEALFYAHVHGEPRTPSQVNADLPREIDQVLLRGLAKDPMERWPTCLDFVDALESALSAPPPVPQEVAPEAAIATVAPPRRPTESTRAGPTRLVIACGLFALALALLVAIVILHGSPPITWPAFAPTA